MDVSSASSIVTALRSYLTSTISNDSKTETSQAGSTSGAAPVDSLELSAEAKALAEGNASSVASEFFSTLDATDGISMDELISLLQEKTSSLLDYMDDSFDIYGIDNSSATLLGTDYQGLVNVLNQSDPDKSSIEALFAQDSDLSGLFQEVSALASSVSAAKLALQFREAYEENPQAALEKYAYLFDESYNPEFNLSYSSDSSSAYITDNSNSEPQYLDI